MNLLYLISQWVILSLSGFKRMRINENICFQVNKMKLKICEKRAYAEISQILGGREGNLTFVYEKTSFWIKKKCVYVGNKHNYAEKAKKTGFDTSNVFNDSQVIRRPLLEKQSFRAGWESPLFSWNRCSEWRIVFFSNNRCYFLIKIWIRSQAKGIYLVRKSFLVALLASLLYFGGSPSGSTNNTKA